MKKILVIKVWGVGSVILASPLFQNIKDNFPVAEIWFLTKNGMENIYHGKFFNKTETIKIGGLFDAFFDFFNLILKIRKNKFDLVIDLEIVSRYTALISYFSGAVTKVGFEITGQNKDKLYDFKVLYHESKHISEMFLNTIKVLGLETNSYKVAPPNIGEKANHSVLSAKYGLKKQYVVVNINASELAYERRLPMDKFKSITENIINHFPDFSIVLVGSKDEMRYVGKFASDIAGKTDNVIDISGKTDISELFCILSKAELVISNDSGPAHIASSFGVPLIVFFGPESPLIYEPNGGEKTVFYTQIHCSPCISVYKDKKIRCKLNAKCLSDIDIGKVNEKVVQYLNVSRDKNKCKQQ